jgi:hypothetical protein
MRERSVCEVLTSYYPDNPLEKASTIPAPWYFDTRIAQLERDSVLQQIGKLWAGWTR